MMGSKGRSLYGTFPILSLLILKLPTFGGHFLPTIFLVYLPLLVPDIGLLD
ncbi:hypothetical protein P872_19865 [Rhodonellum psychrophilum GCM71 = DSM 17998]|uniref:Uncharacterized protein n=1 Tax=Rhodonellum psychrophilum GCM71 = DSM 17998 TaxID=1123057 RepID=U5BVM9_9BACT|nr:hypothetical protein P872_19865 [Rhodonellum psychrophilum GCM71 = DSM 17998]